MSAISTPVTAHFLALRRGKRGSIRDVKDRLLSLLPLPRPTMGGAALGLPWRWAQGLLAKVLGLAWASAVAGAAAAQSPGALPAADLARALALAQQTAERLAPEGAEVSATLGRLDPRLRPAPCTRAEPFLPRGVAAWGATRVGLRCTQGTVAWTLYIPVQVQVRAAGLSLKTAMPAGAVINAADLVVTLLDWSAHPQRPLTDPQAALGRTLARAMSPGAPVLPADLKTRRWFAAGDRVKVVSGGPGFEIEADGLALGDGQDGARVRVQMLLRGSDGQAERGPVVQGQAVAERRVELPL